ncbi:MAG: diguanylate cyclase [Cyanobacteria bacterium J06623_7]
MSRQIIKVLLVEANLVNARKIAQLLQNCQTIIKLQQIANIEAALALIERERCDLIMLSSSLSGDPRLSENEILGRHLPQLPIIVLGTIDDLDLAVRSIASGAQDYLVAEKLETPTLIRSIYLAIERQRQVFETGLQALMNEMLEQIRQSIEPETILTTTARVVREFLRCEEVLIYGCEEEQFAVSLATTPENHSESSELLTKSIARFIEGTNYGDITSLLSALTTTCAVTDTDFCPAFLQINSQLIRSCLLLPIRKRKVSTAIERESSLSSITSSDTRVDREGWWGVLIAYNTQATRVWQDWEIGFLQGLLAQMMVAIQQSQICFRLQTDNQKLQQLAIKDGLTGIANRRYFDLVLTKEYQRLAREQLPLSLILCDVDYFKAYNDTYGHQEGDRCLQIIARILQDCSRRPADLVARYGGEEFALILPNTNAPGALFLAHRIVRQLTKKGIPHLKSQVSPIVTLSLGLTTRIPHPQQQSSTMIEVADSLLYRAKKAGRNQLAVDNWLVTQPETESPDC